MKIEKEHPKVVTPSYATPGSACFDISAWLGEDEKVKVGIAPGRAATFPTGLKFDIPEEHVMLVFSRSGHGFKNDVRLANCVGVIDSDYTGELKVKLTNDNPDSYFDVANGDRIAQALVLPVKQVTFEVVEKLKKQTQRGEGGFGSTGTK